MNEEVNEIILSEEEKDIILSKLKELDIKVGTSEYRSYRDAFTEKYLPKEYHLDFGLWSKKHTITDMHGAKVM